MRALFRVAVSLLLGLLVTLAAVGVSTIIGTADVTIAADVTPSSGGAGGPLGRRRPPTARHRHYGGGGGTAEAFAKLKRANPLVPISRADEVTFKQLRSKSPGLFGFGTSGRSMLVNELRHISKAKAKAKRGEKKPAVVMVEVGVWLGDSVVRWLNSNDAIHVIGVDPFIQPKTDHAKVKDAKMLPRLAARFGGRDGGGKGAPPFNKKLAEFNVREQGADTSRMVLLEGFSPDALIGMVMAEVHRGEGEGGAGGRRRWEGTTPVDVYYIDGGKMSEMAGRYSRGVVEFCIEEVCIESTLTHKFQR